MNGYVVILIDMILIVAMWAQGGFMAGLMAFSYCGIMGITIMRYNRAVESIIIAQRDEIESLRNQK